MKRELIGINIVDLYYCEKSQIISYLYGLGLDNEYCILGEKGIEKYLNEISLILVGFKVNGLCFDRNDCNPSNECAMGCVAANMHESHHLTCCIGRGIAGVLTVRAGCSKGCGEGVSAKEVDGELACNGFFKCKPIDDLGCWLYCYR